MSPASRAQELPPVDRAESPFRHAIATIRLPKDGAATSVQKVQLSADGRRLASRDSDWRVQIWDLPSGKPIATIAQSDDRIDHMVFSRDGRFLITSAPVTSDTIRSWSVANGRPVGELAHVGQLVQLVDGDRVEAVGNQEMIRFQSPSGPVVEKLALLGIHNAEPLQLSSSGDLLLMAVPHDGGMERRLELLDLQRRERRVVDVLEQEPTCAVVSRDGDLVAAAHRQGTLIHAWTSPPMPSTIYLAGHRDAVQALVLTPDELFLLSGGADGVLRVWELIDRRSVALVELPGAQVNSLSVSADGRFLAAGLTGHAAADIAVWDLGTFIHSHGELKSREFASIDEALLNLGGDDGFLAMRYLLQNLDQAFPRLERQLRRQLAPLDDEAVQQQLANLDHPDFRVREHAYSTLLAHRFQIRDQLQAAAAGRVSLETALSLRRLLQPEEPPTPQSLPARQEWRRVVYLLERHASPRARALLRLLHSSHTDERIRQAAQAAELRLQGGAPAETPVENS